MTLTLTQQNLKEAAARTRAANHERFSGSIRDLKERIAALDSQRPDTSILEQIAELAIQVPVHFHVRPGFGFGGGGIVRTMLQHVVAGAVDDARIKHEQIDEEIAQARHKLAQMEAGLARLEAEGQ